MSSSDDLSLENIPKEDIEKRASKIEAFYKADTSQKAALSYHWEKNHLFLDGKQWLIFEGSRDTGGSWSELKPLPDNEYIPRPVTNYIFDSYQTLKGYLLKNKPRITVRPNTQTYADKTAATIAELVSETSWERLREEINYEYAASCLITYGTVFKKSYWDTSTANMSRIPRMVQKPAVDPNTGQPTGAMEEVQAIDEMGFPAFDEVPLGDVSTVVVEPYRIALDPIACNLHEARWIMEYSIRPLSWIKENYDKQEEGYTGLASEVKEEKSLPNSLRRFFQLRTSSGVKGFNSQTTGVGTSGSSEMIENAAVVKECYERPSAANPKGLLTVVANGKTLYVGEPNSQGEDQGDWHPYSECRWEPVPGRFWGKSPFDDATEIQKHINSIDSIVILTRKTMAIPQKLEVDGMVINGQWTGRPGQRVKYRPGPNGEKPELIPSAGVDQQVLAERAQKVNDLKQITGAVDILKGDRPPGVTAASALALLFEVGTGKLFPVLDRWRMFVESDQKKQLKLIAKKYREPRPEFIKILASKNQELTPTLVSKFIGDDLRDNCNVVIEPSSSIPKLKAAEQALLLEVQQTGALDLTDPQNKQEFLYRLGITGFNPSFNKDSNRAKLENMQFDEIVTHPEQHPIVLMVDNHDIHIQIHEDRMKEQSFMELPAEVQQALMQHIEEHRNYKEQAEQQMAIKAAMMGVPPQPTSSADQGPSEPVRKGPGVGQKTKELLGADLFGNSAGVGK